MTIEPKKCPAEQLRGMRAEVESGNFHPAEAVCTLLAHIAWQDGRIRHFLWESGFYSKAMIERDRRLRTQAAEIERLRAELGTMERDRIARETIR